jgi:hypothetical protein
MPAAVLWLILIKKIHIMYRSFFLVSVFFALLILFHSGCTKDIPEPTSRFTVTYDAKGFAFDPVDSNLYFAGESVILAAIDSHTIISDTLVFEGWKNDDTEAVFQPGDAYLIGASNVIFSAIWNTDGVDQEPDCPVFELDHPDGRIFYIDAINGNDNADGFSPATAWQTLSHASNQPYQAGDWIMLRACQEFEGGLSLSGVNGLEDAPVKIGTWGENPSINRAIINCSSVENGITLSNSSHIEIENLEIYGDGGSSNSSNRRGVYVELWNPDANRRHFHLRNLYIHDLFAPVERETDGKKFTVNEGTAIAFITLNQSNSHYEDIDIRDCHFETLGTSGITIGKWASEDNIAAGVTWHKDVTIVDNYFNNIGRDGIVTAGVENVYIARNTILNPGCFDDTRMNGRGDGLWTWFTFDCIVEHNYLRGARGRIDCNGMHVDIGSENNIFQYNLSIDNAGGFCSIIGNSFNNVYRYNISINDGNRVAGTNEYGRKIVDSKVITLSGYNGDRFGENVRRGPFNSYIYNNTIFTSPTIQANFNVEFSSKGALVANNLFYITGSAADISGDWLKEDEDHENIIVDNNRTVINGGVLPSNINQSIDDNWAWDIFLNNFAIDPMTPNPGGLEAMDYFPQNQSVIQDQGIDLYLIPGDLFGVQGGFVPSGDYNGQPIILKPDIGAFEIN